MNVLRNFRAIAFSLQIIRGHFALAAEQVGVHVLCTLVFLLATFLEPLQLTD